MTLQVRQRWERDVLGQILDVGDGLGGKTLDFEKPPFAVYLHVGVNDISYGVPLATIKANFVFFAQSCRENNIRLFVDTIGAVGNADWFNEVRRGMANDVNQWLRSDFVAQFPDVFLIDYLDWSSGGTGILTALRSGMFADDVHPNKAGYASFADYVDDKLGRPAKIIELAKLPAR